MGAFAQKLKCFVFLAKQYQHKSKGFESFLYVKKVYHSSCHFFKYIKKNSIFAFKYVGHVDALE